MGILSKVISDISDSTSSFGRLGDVLYGSKGGMVGGGWVNPKYSKKPTPFSGNPQEFLDVLSDQDISTMMESLYTTVDGKRNWNVVRSPNPNYGYLHQGAIDYAQSLIDSGKVNYGKDVHKLARDLVSAGSANQIHPGYFRDSELSQVAGREVAATPGITGTDPFRVIGNMSTALGEADLGNYSQTSNALVNALYQGTPVLGEEAFNVGRDVATAIPVVAAMTGGSNISDLTGSAIVGGAASGAIGTAATGGDSSDYGSTIGKGAVVGGVTAGLGPDPYGYGTSTGGQAGSAATTAGLVSAAQGDSFDQQLRNAGIAGVSSYVGGTIGEATDSQQAGKFGGMATNLGLQRLWKDPDAEDPADYYNNLIGQYQTTRDNQPDYNQPMVPQEDSFATSERSPLMTFLMQQEQDQASKRSSLGTGQYSTGNDQVLTS